MKTTTGIYIPRLDHLRFAAVFLVFHWHFALLNGLTGKSPPPSFWPFSLVREGHTGVAFFMVISGYIFSRIAIGHSINYGEFIRNRLFRIAPLFLVWISLWFYFAKIDPLKLVLAIFFFLDPTVVPGNGWSVIVEFQCYLIFPFLVLFCNRYGARYLVGLLVISLMLKAGLWLQSGTVQFISYSTVFGRVDQFLCGMIAARVADRCFAGPRTDLRKWLVFALAAVALAYVYHRFDALGGYLDGNAGGNSRRALWIVMPVIDGALYSALIAAYVALPMVIPKGIDTLFARLGEVSYSMYLCHAFVMASVMKLLSGWLPVPITTYLDSVLFGTFVVLPICLGFSFATYHVIEKPFLSFRRNYLEPMPAPVHCPAR